MLLLTPDDMDAGGESVPNGPDHGGACHESSSALTRCTGENEADETNQDNHRRADGAGRAQERVAPAEPAQPLDQRSGVHRERPGHETTAKEGLP